VRGIHGLGVGVGVGGVRPLHAAMLESREGTPLGSMTAKNKCRIMKTVDTAAWEKAGDMHRPKSLQGLQRKKTGDQEDLAL